MFSVPYEIVIVQFHVIYTVSEHRNSCLFPHNPFTGPSATNLIIGSIAGAILVAAIVLGGTGWGFK